MMNGLRSRFQWKAIFVEIDEFEECHSYSEREIHYNIILLTNIERRDVA